MSSTTTPQTTQALPASSSINNTGDNTNANIEKLEKLVEEGKR